MSKTARRHSGLRLSFLMMLFFFFSFLLLALRNQSVTGYILSAAVPLFIFFIGFVLPKLFSTDSLLLSFTCFPVALGFLLLYADSPSAAMQQLFVIGVGLVGMIISLLLVRSVKSWFRLIWVVIPFSLMLLIIPLIWGLEPSAQISGSINDFIISLAGEIVEVSLVMVSAKFLSRGYHIPVLFFGSVCVVLLFFQKNFDSALLCCGTMILLLWVSTGGFFSSLVGLAGFAVLTWYAYLHLPEFQNQVTTWLQPLLVSYESNNHLIQALNAISSAGLWGTGFGLSPTVSKLVYESEFVLSSICGQFGIIFGVCILVVYAAFIWRGASIATVSRSGFHGLLAMGCTIHLGLQTFLSVGGILKLIPLTGASLPFLSIDPLSLVSDLCLTGLILGVESLNLSAVKEAAYLTMLKRS